MATELLVIFQSKIDKRTIASSSGMGNRIDSIVCQSGKESRVGGGGRGQFSGWQIYV